MYGAKFKDESFNFYHHGGGVLSMANAGPNTNSSQFFVTYSTTSHLDKKHVVFGVVMDEDSWEICRAIERMGCRGGATKREIIVKDAGLL